jgi:STE24 endopeptidase
VDSELIVWTGVVAILVGRWLAEVRLEQLNLRHVRAHAWAVPEAYREVMDGATYARSVEYTLAKGRFNLFADTANLFWLLLLVCSGVLPWAFREWAGALGTSVWSMSGLLLVVMVASSIVALPLDYYAAFFLEQRFGFNTASRRTWFADRLKGFGLTVGLGWPLFALILKLVDWTGHWWWLWAWAAVLFFQLLMILVAPAIILPLFNKFTPLPEGSLRDRLLNLAKRTAFAARSIQVMDGSRRSRHSNAFFTGLGRFRKIVLFDTLLPQLDELELEAVLAHEIGHWKKRHIPKMIGWSALSLLGGFFALAWLARQEWFYRGFGFEPVSLVPALLLFGILSSSVTFWLMPLVNSRLRRYEFEADRFAADAMNEPDSLIGALRRLTEKNLGNLTPHPAYSAFHYSHPTLLEREAALRSTP